MKLAGYLFVVFITTVLLVTAIDAKTITVDDDLSECPSANFTSIQAAINNAADGDKILIYNGTYRENVIVNKMLNLTGIGMPTVDGMDAGDVVTITADNCMLNHFEITNSSYEWNLGGLNIVSSNNTIANNIISSNAGNGIFIGKSNNTIYYNTISSNFYGISIFNMYGYSSNNNKIYSNTIQGNQFGIVLKSSDYNRIYSNVIQNEAIGVNFYAASYNTIYSNVISSHYAEGCNIWSSTGNNIYSNEISGNGKGVQIHISSSENTIHSNCISNNDNGIYIFYSEYPSTNNLIYHNDLMDNALGNTYDECTNQWFDASLEEGNYYGDYREKYPDATAINGIWDTPYDITGGDIQDLYPLIAPYIKKGIFDTGEGTYPSIKGTHNGTIEPTENITVHKLFTYSCIGTGGHTEQVRIWNNSGLDVTANWTGYQGDLDTILFTPSFSLLAGETYSYTIRTGSYPQIHHTHSLSTLAGVITCTEFIDANGKKYDDWIPAIKLD
jgi:parallel beta-helix repeat protein